jgi:hypothetical protein
MRYARATSFRFTENCSVISDMVRLCASSPNEAFFRGLSVKEGCPLNHCIGKHQFWLSFIQFLKCKYQACICRTFLLWPAVPFSQSGKCLDRRCGKRLAHWILVLSPDNRKKSLVMSF